MRSITRLAVTVAALALPTTALGQTRTLPVVGETRWLNDDVDDVEFCPNPSFKLGGCSIVKERKFIVLGGRTKDPTGLNFSFYRVEVAGRTGYVHAEEFESVTHDDALEKQRQEVLAAAKAECERRGQPKIGMTTTQAVATCWGKPQRVIKTTTAAGVQQDFVYGGGHILRFENEKLTAILETTE
jgi:hypothetical protein